MDDDNDSGITNTWEKSPVFFSSRRTGLSSLESRNETFISSRCLGVRFFRDEIMEFHKRAHDEAPRDSILLVSAPDPEQWTRLILLPQTAGSDDC